MQSPFDSKNRFAAALDRLALAVLLFLLSVLYFFFLWRSAAQSLLAGAGLFALLLLSLFLLEQRTLSRRELMLRQRLGGAIFLETLVLLPAQKAAKSVCRMLCSMLDAQAADGCTLEYENETWLVRCAQCMTGTNAGAGDVLASHRAQQESGADRCLLCSTTAFTADAIRAAEWVDPPIRLISGRQLAAAAGRLHPASDEEIAEHARRRNRPFSRARIRALAFSPGKTKRYLLCAFLLALLYLSSGSLFALLSMLASFLLAILCHRENTSGFSL